METAIKAPEAARAGNEEIHEATVATWKKKHGDHVEKGETLCELELGKAVVELEATVSGTLRIVAKEGEMVPVGAIVGYVAD